MPRWRAFCSPPPRARTILAERRCRPARSGTCMRTQISSARFSTVLWLMCGRTTTQAIDGLRIGRHRVGASPTQSTRRARSLRNRVGRRSISPPSVREHLEPSSQMDDRNLINTHVARIEIQPEQLIIQLAALRVPWRKTPSKRRRVPCRSFDHRALIFARSFGAMSWWGRVRKGSRRACRSLAHH
jgi:hypothetical protein